MKQEDKDLLLKDLSARLPYGVICKCYHTEFDEWDGKPFVAIYNETLRNIDANGVFLAGGFSYEIDEIKPYLRPMSSMTEEEKKELKTLFDAEEITSDSICYLEGGTLEEYLSHISYSFCSKIIDWLNVNHFDYRGLIPMGLAIEVTKENNPYEFDIKTS